MLQAATKVARDAAKMRPDDAAILDTLAHLVYFAGDLDQAMKIQKKAVENAGSLKAEVQPFLEKMLKEKAAKDGGTQTTRTVSI